MTMHTVEEEQSSSSNSNSSQQSRRNPTLTPEGDIFHLLFLYFSNLWKRLKSNGDRFLSQSGIYENLDKLARQSAKHPYLATVFSIGFILFGIPILIIAVFTLSTIVLTFTGIILIEVKSQGTLISIASVLLFGCLGAAVIVFIFFGCLALASYFGFLHIYDLVNGTNNRSILENFVNREKPKTN